MSVRDGTGSAKEKAYLTPLIVSMIGTMNINDYYEQEGSGEPIVFIHGSFANTATWKAYFKALSQDHHCIAIKLPGHCGLPDPEDMASPTIETELSIIEAVVAELADKPIRLVAHSYGGVVAMSLALKGSIEIKNITLYEPTPMWVFDTVGDSANATLLAEFLAGYRAAVANGEHFACGRVIDFWCDGEVFDGLPEFIKEGMTPLVENNLRHWDVGAILNYSMSELSEVTVPTQLVYGNCSNPAAAAICLHLADALPNTDVAVVNGAHHFLVTSHASECIELLTQ